MSFVMSGFASERNDCETLVFIYQCFACKLMDGTALQEAFAVEETLNNFEGELSEGGNPFHVYIPL